MSGSVLDAVRRVHEEKFFKTEQEAEVRRYIARLKAEGRYESAMEAALDQELGFTNESK